MGEAVEYGLDWANVQLVVPFKPVVLAASKDGCGVV
jgi:hypothetical protein